MVTMLFERSSRLRPTSVHRLAGLLVLAVLGGCATTTVSDRDTVTSGPIARPGQIWVYDFTAEEGNIPAESALAGQLDATTTTPTPAQLAEDRKVGAEISAQLVDQIRAMGMPAAHGWSGATTAINDLVIHGYLLSVREGSEEKRVAIGFSSGGSELKVAVEAFQVTATGLRKLGSEDTDATGSKTPGVGIGALSMLATHNPAGLIISGAMKAEGEESGSATIEGRVKQTVKEIADAMKARFQQQGWIA